jgi:hypothetical protein
MAETRPGSGLSTIFGFFLGLMVTAFVGVGVYTFYPSPEDTFQPRIQELNRQHQAIASSKAPDALSADERARMQALTDQRDRVFDESQVAARRWGVRTSIVLIAFATLIMAISLLRAAQLPVVSNGLLLGGLFTMVYGVGWVVSSDTSTTRFAVISAALAITLAMGYLRFVRGGSALDAPVSPSGAQAPGSAVELEARVRQLEARLDAAARAIQPRDP